MAAEVVAQRDGLPETAQQDGRPGKAVSGGSGASSLDGKRHLEVRKKGDTPCAQHHRGADRGPGLQRHSPAQGHRPAEGGRAPGQDHRGHAPKRAGPAAHGVHQRHAGADGPHPGWQLLPRGVGQPAEDPQHHRGGGRGRQTPQAGDPPGGGLHRPGGHGLHHPPPAHHQGAGESGVRRGHQRRGGGAAGAAGQRRRVPGGRDGDHVRGLCPQRQGRDQQIRLGPGHGAGGPGGLPGPAAPPVPSVRRGGAQGGGRGGGPAGAGTPRQRGGGHLRRWAPGGGAEPRLARGGPLPLLRRHKVGLAGRGVRGAVGPGPDGPRESHPRPAGGDRGGRDDHLSAHQDPLLQAISLSPGAPAQRLRFRSAAGGQRCRQN